MFVSQQMPGYAIVISPNFFRSPTWKRTGATVSVPLRSTRCKFHASVSKLEQPRTDTKTRQEEEEEDEINASVTSVLDGKRGRNKDGVHVPRQKYIPIPKSELLDAILLMFETSKERQDFLIMSSCLDCILHAEHKTMLEEMRVDYDLTHSSAKQTNIQGHASLDGNIMPNGNVSGSADDKFKDFGNKPKSSSSADDLLGISTKNPKMNSLEMSRVPVDSRFQRAFVQLLFNAQFEELSATDLMLTSALNTDYLLTLPIYVDWQRASESKAIIFRRGYATERQRGLLIGEKLDYLQSKLLQGIFFTTSKPLGKLRTWFAEAIKNNIQEQDIESWKKITELRFKELSLFQKSFLNEENILDSMVGVDQLSDKDLPLWLAAQRAVTRYEGILSALGPRGRLLRKLFTWTGLMPSMPEELEDIHSANAASEPYLRPIFLSRISLCDIWEPASSKCCGNDPWKMLKTAVSILFSQSVLQELAFEELILLYTEMVDEKESVEKAEVPMLQLKIYQRIPIPDLPVIFPHKKLSFRILDTVRLDVATIVGLLAYFINYKFENILSSPSAILLDVIAISALVIYVTRIALGYKQTWDRYQLLVSRTLYEKTVASGFGSVHFLLDASEQQQYKEAILAYAILLKSGTTQVTCARIAGDKCERFIYDVFRKKVEMPIDKAINSLLRLGLVMEKEVGGKVCLQAIPCPVAHEILKERWSSLLI